MRRVRIGFVTAEPMLVFEVVNLLAGTPAVV